MVRSHHVVRNCIKRSVALGRWRTTSLEGSLPHTPTSIFPLPIFCPLAESELAGSEPTLISKFFLKKLAPLCRNLMSICVPNI